MYFKSIKPIECTYLFKIIILLNQINRYSFVVFIYMLKIVLLKTFFLLYFISI